MASAKVLTRPSLAHPVLLLPVSFGTVAHKGRTQAIPGRAARDYPSSGSTCCVVAISPEGTAPTECAVSRFGAALSELLQCFRTLALAVLLLAISVCAAPLLHAQTNTAAIYGSATDAQGLAVPAATVTVRSTDLSSARTTTTDSRGNFSLAGLVPGAYTVEVRSHGLTLRHPLHLTLGLGSSTQLTVKLAVATVRQSTTVSARSATSEGNTVAPPINRSEPSISTFLAGTVVTYLPNRDRDVSQFAQLASNAHEGPEGTGVIVAGQRADSFLTEVDGVDLSSPLFGGAGTANLGSEDRSFSLPQTVVREFQVVTSGVSADVGQTDSGFINVATKEGSNKFHGEAMYTARPATLTTADAFNHSLDSFQNTFGGSVGGPIRKDHTFFYTGIEQEFLHAPTFTQFEPQFSTIIIPGSLAQLQGQIIERDSQLSYFGRLDQVLNGRNTLNGELTLSRIRSANLGDGLSRSIATESQSSSLSGQGLFSRIGLTTVLNTHSINQALISYSSDHRDTTPNSTAPEFFINGFGLLGGDALGLHLFTSKQLELGDNVSISRGSRLFTLGGSFDNDPAYEQREANLNGRFDYDSLTDYLNNNPRRFQQNFLTGNTRYSGSVRELALYANARLELHPGLTLTAGLRWAAQFNPQPPHPNPTLTQTHTIPDDLLEWQPRLGIAWQPLSKTVVRLSAGLYTAPTPATIFHRVFADSGTQNITADSYFDPQLLVLTGAFTVSPHALSAPPSGLSTPEAQVVGIDPDFRNPTSLQAAATIDETLSPKLTLRSGYTHASTWHLQQLLDENLYPPTLNSAGVPIFPLTRPIARVGQVLVNQSSAHSSYDGLSLSAISQISRRSQFTLNYTLSRTRDDNSNLGPYSIESAVNPFDLRTERAYSNLDMRNILNVSAIFNLPFGFKLNPLFEAHSAPPYTAIIGFDTQHDANDFNDRAAINNVETGRNIFRGPGFSDADLRLVKDFTLKGEGHHLDLFMDVFNVLGASNRNFGAEQVSFYGTMLSPVASAGQALYAPGATRLGGPREIQFTARLVAF
jgi:hypothetical protein